MNKSDEGDRLIETLNPFTNRVKIGLARCGRAPLSLFVLSLSMTLLLSVGCITPDAVSDQQAQATAPIPTPVDTPELDLTLEPIATPNPTADPAIDLTVWVLPEIDLGADRDGPTTFQAQLDEFAAQHPNINLTIKMKTTVGQGSMLSYVQAARSVAPTVLPDLILIPSPLIEEFINLESAFPIDEFIDAEIESDFFPAAESLGKVDGVWFGYPYVATDLAQATYNQSIFTDTLPINWTDLQATEPRIIFPAGGRSGAKLLLQLYFASGGTIDPADENLTLNQPALERALNVLQDGREAGSILEMSGDLTTEGESWTVFENEEADVTFISANRYLAETVSAEEHRFGPIPAVIQTRGSNIEGWVWIISNADPTKQALAGELMLWMSNRNNLGDWALKGRHIPLRKSAFTRWPEDEYTRFLTAEMEKAETLDPRVRDSILDRFETALRTLFSSENPNIETIASQNLIDNSP